MTIDVKVDLFPPTLSWERLVKLPYGVAGRLKSYLGIQWDHKKLGCDVRTQIGS